ncbi:MAG: glycoside hydrolase family 13 protein [Elusimicrobia bacterium]|nr:glycoside hydrolase family 13 protein [Elusimicrobiota bacterium]
MARIDTPDWVPDAVFYQIFPDRFAKSRRVPKPSGLEPWDSPPTPCGFKGGDLLGVAEKLDYLQDLGINALYFTPVFTSPANHRYHTSDYLHVDPILGGDAALEELLKAAHRRGMRVVLDGVFNHSGRGLYQFNHTLENGAASPYLDWFHLDHARLAAGRPLNAYPRGPREELGYGAWWGLPALPKFDTSTPAVREFIFRVAEHWLRFGVDGWRLDVPSEIDDDSFWREFRRRVKAVDPEAYIVGEIWVEARRWLRGDQFDAVMNYLLTKAVLACFCDRLDMDQVRRTGGDYRGIRPLDVAGFADRVDYILKLYDPAVTRCQLNLLDSHDTPRFLTLARGDEAALRLAATLLFTFPGAPCIYYGDEIGLEGRSDPDCRRAFPWDRRRWDHRLRAFFRRLIRLRRGHPALRRGRFTRLLAQDGVYAYGRGLGRDQWLVALNMGRAARAVDISLPPGLRSALWREAWGGGTHRCEAGKLRGLRLSARGSLILRRV